MKIIPRPQSIEMGEGVCLRREHSVITDDTLPSDGYLLKISEESIEIRRSGAKGLSYAENTLSQLRREYGEKLPVCVISDSPRIKLRSFMLDTARYFFTAEEVCRIIDVISFYRFDCLHLHLTDDQGWRAETERYPRLTETGAFRRRTLFRPRRHGGFYSKDDLKRIVAYAGERGVEVLPEIDIPGHFTAAIAAYPELGCFGDRVRVAENFGVKFDVACPAKPFTAEFIKGVIAELAEIFPCEYFHIGGDEVPSLHWELCGDCRAKKEELGAASWEEYQACFMNEIAAFLKEIGKTPVMWGEHKPTGKVDKDTVWELWSGSLSDEAHIGELKGGRRIINAKSSDFYLDLPYSIVTTERVLRAEAAPAFAEKAIIGAEACLWTELIPSFRQVQKMMFPRLLAVCENLWRGPSDVRDFFSRLEFHYGILRDMGFTPPPRSYYERKGVKKILDRIWWFRRQLYWGGLQNLIKNSALKRRETGKKSRNNKQISI